MPDTIPYGDILILALIAGFILLRLRAVLGQKNDSDFSNFFSKGKLKLTEKTEPQQPIVQLDKTPKAKPAQETDSYIATLTDAPLIETLNAIKAKDPQFSGQEFLRGARMAFEMVFDAFAKGDKQTLKMLMSDAIYQHFSTEIDARAAQENISETTLLSVIAKDITSAVLDKNVARLNVHFESEQVSLVRNAKGEIIEGNASDIHHVENHWLFERDTASKNPNWKIIET